MKYLIAISLVLLTGCATSQAQVARSFECGRPSMLGAEVVCPQRESITVVLFPSRTNADMRGAD